MSRSIAELKMLARSKRTQANDPRARALPTLRPDPAETKNNALRSLSRAAISQGIHASDPTQLPFHYAQKAWPVDHDTQIILRNASGPIMTADAPALATIATAFLSALTAQSAGADLFNRGTSLTFGRAATIRVPALAGIPADFVAEGEAIPVKESLADSVLIARHKLALIILATNELLRNQGAEDLLRAMLLESVGPALDRALFSAAPADAERPAGLLHGITPTSNTGSLVNDLIALIHDVSPVSGNNQLAFVASPAIAAAIEFLPARPSIPILVSTTLPSNMVICIALPAFVSAVEGPPRIDASGEAVVHEESASPAVDIGGGVMAHPLRSIFQSDTVGLKLTWRISWALRDPRGVAFMERT